MIRYFLLLLTTVISLTLFGQAEHIKSFDVRLSVDTGAVLTVTEQLEVYANQNQIKRGIYRSLPLSRNDVRNQPIPIAYEIEKVLFNGNPAEYFTEESSRSFDIYIGNRNVILDPGYYTYTIQYKTYGQIGYYEDYNEIYWNVNGLDWKLPAHSVTAEVVLPPGTDVLQSACYTGGYGSTDRNCESFIDPNLAFSAKDLSSGEGLTVAVGFEKGTISEPPPPTFYDKFRLLIFGVIFSLGLLLYYITTWKRHGVDPPKPTVYPIYEPPGGLSPADVGSLHVDRIDSKMITPSLVNLAVKGYLEILEEEKKGIFTSTSEYTLQKKKASDDSLPPEEKILLDKLFAGGNTLVLDGEYNSTVRTALVNYQHQLKQKNDELINTGRNWKFLAVPILAFLGFFILVFITGGINLVEHKQSFFAGGLFFMMFFLFMIMPIIVGILKKIARIPTNYLLVGVPALVIGLMAIALVKLPHLDLNIYVLIGFITFFIVSIVIYKILIERPSEEKLALQSQVEGFKMYMGAAENAQIQHFNPPAMTPEIFEKLLPYALALSVDEVWGEKFQNYLASSNQVETYHSPWYHGYRGFSPNFYGVLDKSVRESVNSTSTKPSESGGGSWSSGSGGGGFSGGGGGGGGGGGW